ncbi:unnamed protein product [Ectocarpus sp. 12 AP-2014]
MVYRTLSKPCIFFFSAARRLLFCCFPWKGIGRCKKRWDLSGRRCRLWLLLLCCCTVVGAAAASCYCGTRQACGGTNTSLWPVVHCVWCMKEGRTRVVSCYMLVRLFGDVRPMHASGGWIVGGRRGRL